MSGALDLCGRVVLVTGSARGIGRAIVEAAAAAGGRVVVNGRSAEACVAVRDAINAKHPDAAIAIEGDIAQEPQRRALVSRTLDAFGRIDALVMNAAANLHSGSMLSIDDDALASTFQSNIVANHDLCRLVVPKMIEQGSGRLVLISSLAGLEGQTALGAYAISKAAGLQLVRNLAREFGRFGITANAVCPGLIRTEMPAALWDALMKAVVSRACLRRPGEPVEVARAVVFLVSDWASYLTGQVISVDGGVLV